MTAKDTDDTIRVAVTDTYHVAHEVPKATVDDGLDAVKDAIRNGDAEKADEAKHGDPLSYTRKDTEERLD